MKISGIRSDAIQLPLFDIPIKSQAIVRNLIGEWGEQLTHYWLNADRHIVSNKFDYCPDLSKGNIYFENKVSGNSKDMFIFEGRLYKDWEFSINHNLWYIIWHHTCNTKHHQTHYSLFQEFGKAIRSVFVIPFHIIYSQCRMTRLVKLNSKYGRADISKIYGKGYRVPLRFFSNYEIML